MTVPPPVSVGDRYTGAGGSHARRWGVAYLLLGIFLASWVGQLYATAAELDFALSRALTSADFWAATFENWQSEFLQLTFQAVVVVALARQLFRVSVDDQERLERKIDVLLRHISDEPDGRYGRHRTGDVDP